MTLPTRPLRVLHLPVNVGNQAWHLSRGERELGLASDTMEFFPSTVGYATDRCLHLERRGKIGSLAARAAFLARALVAYDVFHFYYADTMFQSLADLPLYAALGKPVFFTFQGCDARFDHSRAWRMCLACDECGCRGRAAAGKRARLAAIRRRASGIFTLNPDLTELHPHSEFLPYASFQRDTVPVAWRMPESGPLRVLHAPSARKLKGTERFLAAMETLKARGIGVEPVLAERMPHRELLDLARTCHLACDQFLSGWYGGFAVEMMALGLPVMAWIDPAQWRIAGLPACPLLSAPAGGIADAIAGLAADPARLARAATEGRAFALTVHDPRRLAARVASRYRAALSRPLGN